MLLPIALSVSMLVALCGWGARALTGRGAVVAGLIGTAVLCGAGWIGGLVLGTFFASSSWVSRHTESRVPVWTDAKGTRRDAWQVMANGGAAALGAVFAGTDQAALWVVTGALATAAADTWATSVGLLSGRAPRHLVNWAPVPAGTSGAVSLVGTLGAAAGAGLVAATAALPSRSANLWLTTVVVGLLGMVADSLLGATLQGRFRCPSCDLASEHRRHRCGAATTHIGGLRWLGNDGVNAVATTWGALAGWGLWRWCS
jgi:uncharacterized protein (TIGR00297 family)